MLQSMGEEVLGVPVMMMSLAWEGMIDEAKLTAPALKLKCAASGAAFDPLNFPH